LLVLIYPKVLLNGDIRDHADTLTAKSGRKYKHNFKKESSICSLKQEKDILPNK